MASDHDAFANWLKTLAPEELAKLKAVHSASAQAAADTAVQDDSRPGNSSSSLSPRSFLVYQNQEAFYHAQEGCYTGPIPACFDYVPPKDVGDLDGADPAQPSDAADPAQPSQDHEAQPSQPPADAGAQAVSEEPIQAGGEYLPMEEPSSSTAFHATPQASLFSMMGQLIDMTAAQSKPINRHELWQLIKRPDLGVAREAAVPSGAVPPPTKTPPPSKPSQPQPSEKPPQQKRPPEVPQNWKPPAQQTFLPDAAKADPPTKAMPQVQQSPPPKPKAAEPGTAYTDGDRSGAEHKFMASDHKPTYSGTERPPQPFGLAVIWDARTWINFYGGEPPKTAVEIDVGAHFYTVQPGPAQDQPSQPEPGQEEDSESSGKEEDLPPCPPLPEWYSADTGVLRYWHFGATGQANPRQMGKQSVPALCLQDMKALPESLVDKRKNVTIDPPSKPYLYKPPALAHPRLPCPNMRNCIIVPSLTLPHTFDLHPAFARMYFLGSRGEMRCGLPCSTVPFCPYHSACGREITEGTVEHRDKHSGHECSRCKEFTDLGRSPFEWFSAVPTQAALGRTAFFAPHDRRHRTSLAFQRRPQPLHVLCNVCPCACLQPIMDPDTDPDDLSNLESWSPVNSLHSDAQRTGRSPSRESRVSPTQERATVVRADKHVLLPLQSAPKTRTFTAQTDTDRREALPLPLAVVVAWERRLCQEEWGLAPSRPIARGGQHPTVEPPFSVTSSPPPNAFQLSALGKGLDRFIYSREAELEQVRPETQPATAESADTPSIPSNGPSEQRTPGANSLPPTIPADDIEALLVESFAASQADSSDSEEHTTLPTVEEIVIFQNGSTCLRHARDANVCAIDLSREDSQDLPDLLLQAIWSRVVLGLIADLSSLTPHLDEACAFLQAIRSSGASALLFLPADHFLFQAPPFCEALHDGGLFLCPEPDSERILIATAPLPTWPCVDPGLAALEAAGRFAAMPLSTTPAQPPTLASALQCHGELAHDRAPICDGAGNTSSADWSRPQPSPAAMQDIMQAWLKWVMEWDYDSMTQAAEGVFDPIEPSGLWPPAKIQQQLLYLSSDVDSLRWLLPRIEAIPTTSLSLPPLVACLARADAMAEGDRVGIGGWITTKHSMAWFAEAWTMDEVRSTWPFLTKDAQKYIACFETLAQLALAMTARERHAFSQFSVCLPSQSDNTPSEAGINKLFTTSWPLSQFLQLIASWSSCHGVDLQVSPVAGAHNQWADDLSRGRLQAFSHRPQERVRVSLDRLASAASQATWSTSTARGGGYSPAALPVGSVPEVGEFMPWLALSTLAPPGIDFGPSLSLEWAFLLPDARTSRAYSVATDRLTQAAPSSTFVSELTDFMLTPNVMPSQFSPKFHGARLACPR
ncbi:HMGB3 [Symbiodinium sp. CCMP2592]|nr:HMGB3 [Symbiodinium sp. CCMP2592]